MCTSPVKNFALNKLNFYFKNALCLLFFPFGLLIVTCFVKAHSQ